VLLWTFPRSHYVRVASTSMVAKLAALPTLVWKAGI